MAWSGLAAATAKSRSADSSSIPSSPRLGTVGAASMLDLGSPRSPAAGGGHGRDASFSSISLAPLHKTLEELGLFEAQMEYLVKASTKFDKDTSAVLTGLGQFLLAAPHPRHWHQPALTSPAEPLHTPVSPELAPLFAADLHITLAGAGAIKYAERGGVGVSSRDPPVTGTLEGGVPGAVAVAWQQEVVAPLDTWMAAHTAAKARMSLLEAERPGAEAALRRLATAKAAAADAELARAGSGMFGLSAEDFIEEKGVVQAQAEVNKFQAHLAAAAEHLHWCTTSAARLRAYLADVLGAAQAALEGCEAPPGLLPAFPVSLLGEHNAAPTGDRGDAASDISTSSSSDLSFTSAADAEGAGGHVALPTGTAPTGTAAAAASTAGEAAAPAGSSGVGEVGRVPAESAGSEPDVPSHPLPEIRTDASLPAPADIAAAAQSVLEAPATEAFPPVQTAAAGDTGGAGSGGNQDGGAGPAGAERKGGVMYAILRTVRGGSA